MDRDVNQYISTYAVCQKTKARRHKPYGELSSLPQPSRPFTEVTLDFIVGLLLSKQGASVYDVILVIVDCYMKHATYIPITCTLDAKGLAALFIDEIVRHYGVPKGIISDRGSIFNSEFQYKFYKLIRAARCISTTFHPQMDSQTKWQNQTLK